MVRLPAWLSCIVALGLVLGACGGSGGPTAGASPAAAGATVTIYSGVTLLYYVTGQFSRFVRPGAQRVRVDDAGSGLKLTAYRDGDRVIVVAVNDGAAERTVTIRLANERAAGQMTAVRPSATEGWAALPPVAVSAGAFSTTFPAGSVTTLTTGLGR